MNQAQRQDAANQTASISVEEEVSDPHGPAANLRLLMIGALGVVYGDIGTSPIYAFREALHAATSGGNLLRGEILGVISLIVWALALIVTVKYVLFVLRADNNGEGGILSLMALVRSSFASRPDIILGIGIIGASLFFGDAVITPAISVLSAVEGLEIVAPSLTPYVVPITVSILLVLFFVQRHGTGRMASIFGPVMMVWFLALGITGFIHIFDDPGILAGLNPYYAYAFLGGNPGTSFATVGAIFLAVTGAEALYADLGHFGRRPIVRAWLWIVFPCLILNYFGQGAFILSHSAAGGAAVANPFFQMMPQWALLPMVLLATAATVIASQAVLTGTYSLARQAVQLNILPRLEVLHTSETLHGQIYMPRINMLLGITVVLLVVVFQKSTNLAAAYGIAVTGNMLVTTTLLFFVMRRLWKWSLPMVLVPIIGFALVDLMFFSANIVKVHQGGWASIMVAAIVLLVMWTWVRGSRHLFQKTRKTEVPLDLIIDQMTRKEPVIVAGTAVFLTGDPASVPTALMHSLKHYKVLHENNVILTVVTAPKPWVPAEDRARVSQYSGRFMLVTLSFGYMQSPNIPRALGICRKLGWKYDIMTTSFFLSRRVLRISPRSPMPRWQAALFIMLARTASDATEYFQIPTGRVVEIGTQVNL